MKSFVTWVILVVLVACEFFAAQTTAIRGLVPYIGLGMAALVALTFMRLGSSRGLVPVFAIAGVFWLAVMMGLGSLDSFTRHDVPVSARTLELPGR